MKRLFLCAVLLVFNTTLTTDYAKYGEMADILIDFIIAYAKQDAQALQKCQAQINQERAKPEIKKLKQNINNGKKCVEFDTLTSTMLKKLENFAKNIKKYNLNEVQTERLFSYPAEGYLGMFFQGLGLF